jgi:PAS domain S-box-containing protein
MPEVPGIELCRRLHELDRGLPVIVMTAHSDMQSAVDSLRAGAEDYLVKPLELDAVLWCAQRALKRRADRLAQDEVYRTLNEALVLSNVREHEQREAEARQRAQLNALLENLSEGVVIADANGELLIFNRAGRAILGLADSEHPAEEVRSLQAFDISEQALAAEQHPLARATSGEQFTDYEIVYALLHGERRRVTFTGTSVKDENGDIAMVILLFRDVTEMRRLEQQRDEYLALISHDLRNPLSTILMSVSNLKGALVRAGASAGVRAAERAERNVKRMTVMLEDLSEATSLESQNAELRRETLDLGEVVAGVVEGMEVSDAQRVTIETDAAPPYRVLADRSRLERAVVNLLANALKYSGVDAPVKVRIAHEGNTTRLDVVDRGIGIEPASIDLLFNRYYRTAAGRTSASGSGLGLYIARLIAEAHGGHIEVSSEVGKGSEFRLVMPESVRHTDR